MRAVPARSSATVLAHNRKSWAPRVSSPGMPKIRPSAKASSFTESVIREMTRLAIAHDAINLSQGFPDFPAPQELKDAARAAILRCRLRRLAARASIVAPA